MVRASEEVDSQMAVGLGNRKETALLKPGFRGQLCVGGWYQEKPPRLPCLQGLQKERSERTGEDVSVWLLMKCDWGQARNTVSL